MASTEHTAELLITALGAVHRSDWSADPRGFIRAQNQLFDAVIAAAGFPAAERMSESELEEYAATRASELMGA